MKRRIVAALLALGIPLTLLTSCGSKNAADQFFDTLTSVQMRRTKTVCGFPGMSPKAIIRLNSQ